MKFLELCSGIGGFRLGLEKNGFECVGYSEIDNSAIKVYSKYFNDFRNLGDVTKIDIKDIPDIDILVGGFPCQAFSISGKRKGFNDTRGTIFFEFARITKEKRPKVLFFENVKGLLNHDRGRTFTTILTTIYELGYDVGWYLLNSKNFGLPQNRERVFIIATDRKRCTPKILFEPKDKKEVEIDERNLIKIGNIKDNNSQGYRVYDIKGISTTIISSGGGMGAKTGLYLTLDNRIRKLTPLECFRLQGFPEDMYELSKELNFSDTQIYKIIGNAVSVNVIDDLAKKIKDSFF